MLPSTFTGPPSARCQAASRTSWTWPPLPAVPGLPPSWHSWHWRFLYCAWRSSCCWLKNTRACYPARRRTKAIVLSQNQFLIPTVAALVMTPFAMALTFVEELSLQYAACHKFCWVKEHYGLLDKRLFKIYHGFQTKRDDVFTLCLYYIWNLIIIEHWITFW